MTDPLFVRDDKNTVMLRCGACGESFPWDTDRGFMPSFFSGDVALLGPVGDVVGFKESLEPGSISWCVACRPPLTRERVRARLVALIDQAMSTVKEGESVYAVLAKLLVTQAVEEVRGEQGRVAERQTRRT